MASEAAERHYSIDVGRMIDRVIEMPGHIRQAWEDAEAFSTSMPASPSRIVISGMGGSSIGGSILRDFAGRGRACDIHIERGYDLPSFAGTDTNVVCVSYSGNTEEVLGLFKEGLDRGCGVSVITSGGQLGAEAERAGVPAMIVPGGLAPRAALGYLFTPLLRAASRWGFVSMDTESLESGLGEASALIESCMPGADLAGNRALMLAKRLYGKIPLIYSGNGLLAGTAYRWKCQFNENSKSMAFCNIFPELGHNEVMAWECPERMREDLFLLMLCDGEDHPRVQKRMYTTYSLLEPLAGGAMRIESTGQDGPAGRLSRLLSTIVLGDLTSVYLAVEYGRDPTPIGKIEEIKEVLRSED
ncbi:MAG TPA: bifunctional phosphoglucose/phosphomannose isomerase [Candidatus Krumholzibacterium sp.]|nr:bifunctional phosphoglucose/phosphomannose isomerase [Candidatus Krumholzibacterium sp.]